MKFKKYSEIENTYREKHINQIIKENLNGGDWEVSVKIHGSNFAVYYDGDNISFAKRSGFLEDGENFYNHESIKNKLEEYVKLIWLELGQTNLLIDQISLHGELFGGSYSGIKSNTKAVQKGVFYSPELQFYAFDLKINEQYVDMTRRLELFDRFNIPYAPILFTGSFRECLEFDPVFEDPIYMDFGLPEIEGNIAEGVVIKPCESKFFGNGSRVILKNKNEKFKEKIKGGKKNKEPEDFSPEIEAQINNILEYINENRLRNVLSKIGEVAQKDFGRIIKDFNADIMGDYLKDHGDLFEALDKSDQKVVTKKSNKVASELLRQNFLNIIDNIF